jgi:methyl-accepting chemotaxis protein
VELAESAGRLLDTIVPSIKNTSDLIEGIAAASTEQTAGAGQINAAVSQMSNATQFNAASSEELAGTAARMSSQAEQVQRSMSFFKPAGAPASVEHDKRPGKAPMAKRPAAAKWRAAAAASGGPRR